MGLGEGRGELEDVKGQVTLYELKAASVTKGDAWLWAGRKLCESDDVLVQETADYEVHKQCCWRAKGSWSDGPVHPLRPSEVLWL